MITHSKVDEVGSGVIHVDAERSRAGHACRLLAIDGQSGKVQMDIVNQRCGEVVLVANNRGLRALIESGTRCGQEIVAVERRVCVVVDEVTAEDCVLRTLCPVHPGNRLVLVIRIRNGVSDLAAWIGGSGDELEEVKRGSIEGAWVDLVPSERRPGCRVDELLGLSV